MDIPNIGKNQLQISTVQTSSDYTGLQQLDIIQLYEPASCLRCTDLLELTVEDARELQRTWGTQLLSNMKCHYSNGNTQCPAGTMRIVRLSDVDKAVDAYMEAMGSGDIAKLSRIVNAINQKDESTINLVMSKIKERMNSKQVSDPVPEPVQETPEPINQNNEPTTPHLPSQVPETNQLEPEPNNDVPSQI